MKPGGETESRQHEAKHDKQGQTPSDQECKELNTKEGVSILLAEQNTNVALKNSDYGYIIETGRVMLL